MSRPRRGLTLLETLLAAGLLAMLAGVCVPTLSSVLRTIESEKQETINDAQQLRFDLSQLADAFMHDPQKFGCKDLQKEIEQNDMSINWPDELAGEKHSVPVAIHRLRGSGKDAGHCWLAFICDGQTVARYLALQKESGAP